MSHPPIVRAAMQPTLCRALLAGCSYREACERADIPWSTWTDWLKIARRTEPDPDVAEIVRAAREAHAKSTEALTAFVAVAAKSDWKAALGLLEFRATAARRNADASRAHWQAKLAKKLALESTEHTRPVVTIAAEGAALLDLREDK